MIVRQFRPGPGRVLLELPGGAVEKDERPEDAAKRELLEETGFAGELKLVQSSWHSAYSTLFRFHFVAINCHQIQGPQNDEHEFTQPILMSLPKYKQHLASGELTDLATALIGLQFLEL